GGIPTGTVTFQDGAAVLGMGTLDSAGTAAYTTGPFTLGVGAHSITAVYAGDGNYASSTSTALAEAVSPDATTTAVSAGPRAVVYGQPVTITAAVSAGSPGSGLPTGAVTFRDGATILGKAVLDATGTATFTPAAF